MCFCPSQSPMWLDDGNVTQQLDRRDFKSKDLSRPSCRAPVESIFTRSISFLLVVTKPGSDCWKLPVKAPKEDEEEEIQGASTSRAAGNELSMDVVDVLSTGWHFHIEHRYGVVTCL